MVLKKFRQYLQKQEFNKADCFIERMMVVEGKEDKEE